LTTTEVFLLHFSYLLPNLEINNIYYYVFLAITMENNKLGISKPKINLACSDSLWQKYKEKVPHSVSLNMHLVKLIEDFVEKNERKI